MPAVQALLFEDAFLFEEDATALETLIVRANNGAVDITVEGRKLAISLTLDEVKAIYDFVKLTHSLGELRAEARQLATAMRNAAQSVDTVAAEPEADSITWQPPWESISEKIAVICKNKDERVWGYPAKPTAGTTMWTYPGGGWRFPELDNQISGNWWESLFERPAPVGNVAAEPDPEPATWQPDWAEIIAVDPRIHFVTKDEDERVFGYILEPSIYGTYVVGGVWTDQPDSDYFRLPHLDNQIPGDWRESLYKRPE